LQSGNPAEQFLVLCLNSSGFRVEMKHVRILLINYTFPPEFLTENCSITVKVFNVLEVALQYMEHVPQARIKIPDSIERKALLLDAQPLKSDSCVARTSQTN
jgi:hypothetical protein